MDGWKCPKYQDCYVCSIQECPYWNKDNEHRLMCKISRVDKVVTVERPVKR